LEDDFLANSILRIQKHRSVGFVQRRILQHRGIERMPTGRVKFFEAAGMDTLVAGQLLAYDIGTARDGQGH
jgi:hypothetical protein